MVISFKFEKTLKQTKNHPSSQFGTNSELQWIFAYALSAQNIFQILPIGNTWIPIIYRIMTTIEILF